MKLRLCFLLTILACALPSLPAKEPANLALLKQEIRTYVDSGEYEKDIGAVATEAKAWLKERAPKGGSKLAIVFDLDETLLSNWPEYVRFDLGSERKALADWFESAKCPVISPVRELYQLARALGIEVIYTLQVSAQTTCHLLSDIRLGGPPQPNVRNTNIGSMPARLALLACPP